MTIRRHHVSSTDTVRCFDLAAEAGSGHDTLRVELDDRIVSVPLHELRRWTLILGDAQRLVIDLGQGELIVATGHALAPVHEALDRGKLAALRRSQQRRPSEPFIRTLAVIDREAPAKAGR